MSTYLQNSMLELTQLDKVKTSNSVCWVDVSPRRIFSMRFITIFFSVISLLVISGAVTASTKKSDNSPEPVTDYLSFAAAADPQFNKRINHPIVAFQNDIAGFLLGKLYNDETYKGLIIAGDLTERTYKWEILKLYNSPCLPMRRTI